jgi:hypothetical protein
VGRKILTIDMVEPDRDFIVINGKPYYLRNNDELSLVEIARIRRLSKTIKEKGLDMDLDGEEANILEVEDYVNQVLDVVVLGLGYDLRDRLNIVQKFSITRAFLTASSERRARTEAGMGKQAPPTTDSLSPGSSGSTEEASAAG